MSLLDPHRLAGRPSAAGSVSMKILTKTMMPLI